MFKALALLAMIFVSLNAFSIYETALSYRDQPLKDINWPFTICGKGSWTIQKLTLGSTPARNTNDDITITGSADDDVTFEQVDLEVKLNGLFLHSQTVKFASSFSAGDTVQFKYTNFIPSFAPPGTYAITFTFKSRGSANGCLGMQFKL